MVLSAGAIRRLASPGLVRRRGDGFPAAITAGGNGNLEEAVLCAQLIDLAQRSSAAGGVRLAVDKIRQWIGRWRINLRTLMHGEKHQKQKICGCSHSNHHTIQLALLNSAKTGAT